MFYTGWNSPCDSDGFDKCVTAKVDGKVISIKILKSVRASELWIMNMIEVKVADIAYAKEFKIILEVDPKG